MRRFVIRFIIFALPFVVATLWIFSLSWAYGETKPPAWFAQIPYNEALVYAPAWERENIANFKLEMTLLHQPEVLIIGSSRTLQISSQIFNLQPNAVYMAGISSASINENAQFISLLASQQKMPRLLILAMDYPDFNAERVRFRDEEIELGLPSLLFAFNHINNGTMQTAREFIANPPFFFQSNNEYGENYRFAGITALKTGIGFLPDGHEYYPFLTEEYIQQEVDEQTNAFRRRTRQYEVGSSLSDTAMNSVETILQLAQANGTMVVGYFPPYRESIYQAIIASPDFAYIPKLQSSMNELFQDYNYHLFDFSDVNSVGGNDAELFDTWHSSELLNVRVYLHLSLNIPEIFDAYIDPNQLASILASAIDPFYVFYP